MADLNSIGGLHYEMMRRCYNEKSVAYKEYGAKGISLNNSITQIKNLDVK